MRPSPPLVRPPRARWQPLFGLCLAISFASTAGCRPAGDGSGTERGPQPQEIIRLASGPLQEIRIARDTDGRIVVSGFCYFPDDTRLTIALHDSLGQILAQTRPAVESGRFTALPLDAGELAPGDYEIGVSAVFSPEEQAAGVLEETGDGRALTGEGTFVTRRGHPAFAKRFPVEP